MKVWHFFIVIVISNNYSFLAKLVCLYHYDHLCNTCEKSNFILLYGFQVEEIQNQAMRLREYIVENTRGKGKIEKNEKH